MKKFIVLVLVILSVSVYAISNEEKIQNCRNQIEQLENKIKSMRIFDNGSEFKKASQTKEEKEIAEMKKKIKNLRDEIVRLQKKGNSK